MQPTPSPSPTSPPNVVPMILHSFWTAIWSAVAASPLIGLLLGLIVLGFVVRIVRAIALGPIHRDPIRAFSQAQRQLIFTWAGRRCERHGLFGRCRATDNMHADHIHPWSKGGQTALANGAALCSRHNKTKGARVPWNWELKQLEKRRLAYFPPGVSGVVVRRAPRRKTKSRAVSE
jgi:hypothetical protein